VTEPKNVPEDEIIREMPDTTSLDSYVGIRKLADGRDALFNLAGGHVTERGHAEDDRTGMIAEGEGALYQAAGGTVTKTKDERPEWDIIDAEAEDFLPDEQGNERRYTKYLGYLKLFDEINYNDTQQGGSRGWHKVLVTRVSIPNLKSIGFNDRCSSIINSSNRTVTCYSDADYKGRSFMLTPGRGHGLLRRPEADAEVHTHRTPDRDYDWNDKVSSIKFHT
jgi:hypothetical protein